MSYEDPTAFKITTDPTKRIMSGRTIHKNLDFEVPFMSKIAPNLWNGGCENGLELPFRIKHVVSLYQWESYKVGHELFSKMTVKMFDSLHDPVDREQILALARWVNVCRKTGETLVHCQAGLNRSGMVVAVALMLEGMSAREAIDTLREKRSHASICNQVFEDFLLDLDLDAKTKPLVDPGQVYFTTHKRVALHRTRSAQPDRISHFAGPVFKSVCGQAEHAPEYPHWSRTDKLENLKVCSNCWRKK